MPIEIRELIIRANITGDANEREERADTQSVTRDERRIIEACVDQVMKILKNQKER